MHRLVRGLKSRVEMLEHHVLAIQKLVDGRAVWMPAFNYDFCRTGYYNTRTSVSQVGPIPEFFRLERAVWRTPTPVFSITGQGEPPKRSSSLLGLVDPFGSSSSFADLTVGQGIVVWYGAPITALTIMHYAERMSGGSSGPLYRYDKLFAGRIVDGDDEHRVVLNYHVRPLVGRVQYDRPRIEADLRREGIFRDLDAHGDVRWAPAQDLSDYWIEQLNRDPLYLLDDQSRTWVSGQLSRLGRRFTIEDFESEDAL
jgi:aminoglycoside N3'-acetyltransferase